MQAFVLNCIGDVFHRRGDLAQAQEWYQRAAKSIVKSPTLVIFATIVKNLGDVAYAQKQYPHAEQYYEGAGRSSPPRCSMWTPWCAPKSGAVAAKNSRAPGSARRQAGEAAVHISRKVGLKPYLKQNLQHLSERICISICTPSSPRSDKS